MKDKVKRVIDKIKPMLQADGGNIELVSVKDGVVTVKLQGACRGCPMSQMTLKHTVKKMLKQEVKGVKKVVSV